MVLSYSNNKERIKNMFTSTVIFSDNSPKVIKFEDLSRAKSYAGHEFNRTDVLSVNVSDSDKVYLNLDKTNPDARISIR